MNAELTSIQPVMRTASGKEYNPLKPDPAVVRIEDIAMGLARTSRYGGNQPGKLNYNNAQHSLLVLHAARCNLSHANVEQTANQLLMALLHDAAEGYLGLDVPSPIKHLVQISGKPVAHLEEEWLKAIFEGLGLNEALWDDPLLAERTKTADWLAKQAEEEVIWAHEFDLDADWITEAMRRIAQDVIRECNHVLDMAEQAHVMGVEITPSACAGEFLNEFRDLNAGFTGISGQHRLAGDTFPAPTNFDELEASHLAETPQLHCPECGAEMDLLKVRGEEVEYCIDETCGYNRKIQGVK